MKIRIAMKTPDAVDHALAAHGLDESLSIAKHFKKREEIRELCRRWFRFGEVVVLEIDTKAKTCTVLENQEGQAPTAKVIK
jgi:hypothetical protein